MDTCENQLLISIKDTYDPVAVMGIVHGLASFAAYITLFITYAKAKKEAVKHADV